MGNVLEVLCKYGFHDTMIHSIDIKENELVLHFGQGLFFLDENRNETVLSKPISLHLHIDLPPYVNSVEQVIEIQIYGKRIKSIDYERLKKIVSNMPFSLHMVYFSPFCNTLLFVGGVDRKECCNIIVENVQSISIVEKC